MPPAHAPHGDRSAGSGFVIGAVNLTCKPDAQVQQASALAPGGRLISSPQRSRSPRSRQRREERRSSRQHHHSRSPHRRYRRNRHSRSRSPRHHRHGDRLDSRSRTNTRQRSPGRGERQAPRQPLPRPQTQPQQQRPLQRRQGKPGKGVGKGRKGKPGRGRFGRVGANYTPMPFPFRTMLRQPHPSSVDSPQLAPPVLPEDAPEAPLKAEEDSSPVPIDVKDEGTDDDDAPSSAAQSSAAQSSAAQCSSQTSASFVNVHVTSPVRVPAPRPRVKAYPRVPEIKHEQMTSTPQGRLLDKVSNMVQGVKQEARSTSRTARQPAQPPARIRGSAGMQPPVTTDDAAAATTDPYL